MTAEPSKAPSETPAPAAPPPAPEVPDYYDQLLRLKAEFENYRKRVDREKPELVRHGKAEVLLALLPILPRPCVRPTAVVVLPSPAFVGVMAVVMTSLPSGRSRSLSRTDSDTFAL